MTTKNARKSKKSKKSAERAPSAKDVRIARLTEMNENQAAQIRELGERVGKLTDGAEFWKKVKALRKYSLKNGVTVKYGPEVCIISYNEVQGHSEESQIDRVLSLLSIDASCHRDDVERTVHRDADGKHAFTMEFRKLDAAAARDPGAAVGLKSEWRVSEVGEYKTAAEKTDWPILTTSGDDR